LNFKSATDLFAAVRHNMQRIPRDIDLVVGIPRSGILAACAVSLAIHKPFTDFHSFIEKRVRVGLAGRMDEKDLLKDYRSILIIDDSIDSGNTLRKARSLIEASHTQHQIAFAAVFGLRSSHAETDFVLEVCPQPRVFEWNVMNHWSLGFACVDLDGVICADPTDQQNDDGNAYLEFIETAPLLNSPRYRINSIVTSRLEKYRSQTERWLRRNSINYGNLFMLDVSSAEERRRLAAHGKFKAEIFKSQKNCLLFIESEAYQAEEIRALSGKSVLAYKDMKFFPEKQLVKVQRSLRQVTKRFLPRSAMNFVKTTLKL